MHLDTEGKGNNVEKEEIGSVLGSSLAGKDTSLDGSTVSDSLVRIDALLELLAVEEVAQELLNLGDTGRATNEDNLVDLGLVDTRVLENLVDWGNGALEGLGIEVLEPGTCYAGVEVLAIEQRVNLDSGLGTVGKSTLGTLASSAESS